LIFETYKVLHLGFFAVKEWFRNPKGQTFDLRILFQKVPQLKSDFFGLAVDFRPDITLASVVSANPVELHGHTAGMWRRRLTVGTKLKMSTRMLSGK
jgi:hypothetical protein